jgi:hypothetical protein
MKTIFKCVTVVALTGTLALAAASPSQARYGRNAAAIGFGVGAVAGAAIANSAYDNNYYGYYGYYDDAGYAYAPGYVDNSYVYDPYSYDPGPSYGYRYDYGHNWSRQHSTNNFSIDSQR